MREIYNGKILERNADSDNLISVERKILICVVE